MMGGVSALKDWNGGFNITYHIGPGFVIKKLKLKMVVNNVFENATIDNIIGTIPGYVEPGEFSVHLLQ